MVDVTVVEEHPNALIAPNGHHNDVVMFTVKWED